MFQSNTRTLPRMEFDTESLPPTNLRNASLSRSLALATRPQEQWAVQSKVKMDLLKRSKQNLFSVSVGNFPANHVSISGSCITSKTATFQPRFLSVITYYEVKSQPQTEASLEAVLLRCHFSLCFCCYTHSWRRKQTCSVSPRWLWAATGPGHIATNPTEHLERPKGSWIL